MKIDQIAVGQYVSIKRGGQGVIIDIGKYETAYVSDEHETRWRGLTIRTSGSWYTTSTNVGTRRAVVLHINGQLSTVTPASIAEVWSEERVVKLLTESRVEQILTEAKEQYVSARDAYYDTQRGLVNALLGNNPDRLSNRYFRSSESAFAPLADSDLIKQMLLLYLQYKLQRGEEIDSLGDLESAIETLRDSVRGQREAERLLNERTTAAQLAVQREDSEIVSAVKDKRLRISKVTA